MDISFAIWERRRRDICPEPERILPLVAAAGSAGMTRVQLGHAVDLDQYVLDELLTGMVGVGLLTVTAGVGSPVYRTVGGGG